MESMAPDTELDIDEGDLENLESEVKQMAKKISEYRQTLPDLLRNTLDSALSSLVPVIPNVDSGSIAETQASVVVGTEEQDSREKMIRLKEIMSRNAANIPKAVKRIRDCIERIDKLDSLDVTTIHPAFRRRKN
ncbi:PREDICTED: uncharacterized protein LOC104737725 [Camelina sativa]|uniref:Uncharacterized protein LOC104737725 n=1 Tax=Camelina sativa TaxID=90675 RepID=A0ABM0VHM5_CAMSA|nr:PREDICTED: uncharacterized protein LOC104737725 [Camelina sativa]